MVIVRDFLRGFADKFAETPEESERILQVTQIIAIYRWDWGRSYSSVCMKDCIGIPMFNFFSRGKDLTREKVNEEFQYVWNELVSKHTEIMKWLSSHIVGMNESSDYSILEKENMQLDIHLYEYDDRDSCTIYPAFDGLTEVIHKELN